jgi:hypothetical protein
MKTLRRKKLRLEPLEVRTVMTGNVTAVVQGGVLVVTGDTEDNGIVITQTEAGNYLVEGDETTTINGGGSFESTSTVRSFKINMKDGNDSVAVQNLDLRQFLVLDGGAGNDTLSLSNVSVGLIAAVRGGAGDDGISVEGVDVGATLLVDAGKGINTIGVNGSEGTVLLINAKKGTDTVTKSDNDFNVTLQPSLKLKAKVADALFASWEKAFARVKV